MGSRANCGGSAEAKGSKGTKAPVANGIPRHAAARAAERSPASAEKSAAAAERRSPKIASRVTSITPCAQKHCSIQEELRRAKDQLAEKEAENRRLQEMFRAVDLEQTTIQRRLDEARQDLADAIDSKDHAITASEENAAKVELLNAEINRLKDDSFHSCALESRVRESAEKSRKMEAELSVLRMKLKKAKITEEKLAELEGAVQGLRADVANAIEARREADELVGEWKKKAQLMEIKLDVANQSSILKAESLNSAVKELDAANASLQEKQSQLALLQDKVESLEHQVVMQKEDINASGHRLHIAQREAYALRAEIRELRSRLCAMERDKTDAISNGSSQIEAICEEKDMLAKELESCKDEYEKVRKAMEDLASALQEMSAEARESRERYLDKQEEFERAQAQVEELNVILNNTRENYELMLDEANYERVCLKNKVEELEAETKTTSEERQSKEQELCLVSSITNSEEEIMSMRIQLDKTADSARDLENRNAQLEEKIRELEAQVAKTQSGSKDGKAYKQNEQQNVKQENEGLYVKEPSNSEKIKDLYTLIGNDKGNTEKDGPVLLVSKMFSKIADYNLSKERDNGEPEVDLDTNRDNAADAGRLPTDKTSSNSKLVTKQNMEKKALMKKFGGLLKKKSQH
uniref:WEB family protein n=1 Tax=Leersia perrieri TaxID=77586 RepID=A0A0D9WPU8_9ORYZ